MDKKLTIILILIIVFFELYRIKQKHKITWIDMPISFLGYFKTSHMTLLNFTFFFSLLSIQLTMWGFYFTGKYINIYQVLFGFWYFIILLICVRNYKFDTYDKKIIFLMLYLLTMPVIQSDLSMRSILVGFKATMVPLILYFFLKIALNSLDKIHIFLRVIVYGGIISSIYVIIEFFNRLTNFWPPLYELPLQFTRRFRPFISNYAEDLVELKSFLIRPLGILLDMHPTVFITVTGFFIVLMLGNKLFKNNRSVSLIQTLLLLGILFATIKTYIYMLVGMLLVLLVLNKILNIRKNPAIADYNRQLGFTHMLVSIAIVISAIFFYDIFEHIVLKRLGLTGAPATLYHYTDGFFVDLLGKNIPYLLAHHPLTLLLGHGYGTDASLAGEMHFLGRQLALLGLVGFCIFWGIFLRVALESYRAIRRMNRQKEDSSIFIFGVIISLAFAGSLVHYSPLNLTGQYIGALLLFIGNLAYKYNRGISSPLLISERKDDT